MAGTTFDTTRVRLGDLVAGAAGVLLFLSLFFHWYSVSASSVLGSISGSVSGWQILSFIDILLFVISLIAVGVAVARMAGAIPRMQASPGLVVLGVGLLATVLVLIRIFDTPGDLDTFSGAPGVDVSRSFGIFVALIASLGITAGGWIGWNEEGRPRFGGRVTGAPPASVGSPSGGAPQAPTAFEQPTQAQPAATAPREPAVSEAAVPAEAPTPEAAPQPSPAPTPPESADAPPPGGAADWYPDPRGEKRLRYWDGTQWTHHTAD